MCVCVKGLRGGVLLECVSVQARWVVIGLCADNGGAGSKGGTKEEECVCACGYVKEE